MRCETTVGTEKHKRLVGVSLNTINYKHGARGEITYFNHRAKRVKGLHIEYTICHVKGSVYSLVRSAHRYIPKMVMLDI